MSKIWLSLFIVIHTFFTLQAQNIKDEGSCGVKDDEILTAKVKEILKTINTNKYSNLKKTESPKLECLIAVSVDNSLYEYFNRDADLAKNYVYDIVSKVSKIYEDEINIKLTVSYIEIWDSRFYTNIGDFDTYWRGISKEKVPRHISHVFKLGKLLSGASGIASNGIGPNGEYIAVSASGQADLRGSVQLTMAHEIGHNFGSPHTHNCLWPDGPIDACESIEGNCFSGNYVEYKIGTIMSYCNKTALTFHPYCVELIRQIAQQILPQIQSVPNTPTILNEFKTTSNAKLTPFLNWEFSPNTEKYRIQISTKSDFSNTIIDSLVLYNQFQAFKLTPKQTYFWRVKAINFKGESNWTTTATFSTKDMDTLPEILVISSPADEEILYNAQLQFTPSPNATDYEIEIADEDNWNSSNRRRTIKLKTNQFSYRLFRDEFNDGFFKNYYMWRVRAVNSSGVGPWSQIKAFKRDVRIAKSFPSDKQSDIPLNLPLSWVSNETSVNKKMEVQVSTKSDYSTLFYSQKMVMNPIGSVGELSKHGVINLNLNPNTTYYFKIKDDEGNSKNEWLNYSFTTAKSDTESKKWKVINQSNSPTPTTRSINSFYIQPTNGKIWIGNIGLKSTDGVNWYENFDTFNSQGNLANEYYNLTSDSKGNLWFKDFSRLGVYDNNFNFKFYSSRNAPFQSIQFGLAVDNKDNVYTFAANKDNKLIVYKFDGNQWTTLESPIKADDNSPVFLIEDSEKNIWSTSETGGRVAKLENGVWKFFSYDLSKIPYLRYIYSDKQSNIWISGGINYAKLSRDGNWSYFSLGDIDYFSTIKMAFDNNNVQYLMTNPIQGGYKLYKVINNNLTEIPTKATPFEAIMDGGARELAFDSKNRLWIASYYNGIFVYDEKAFVKSQTIQHESITPQQISSGSFNLKATSTSKLPVTYSIVSGPATINGDKVTLTNKEGKITIRYSQAGNNEYDPAPNIDVSIELKAKAAQTITFPSISNKIFGDAPFTLNATSNSGLPISYVVSSGPATVSGNIITVTGYGKITVKAVQAGNDLFFAANDVTVSFCVAPSVPTITSDVSNPFLLKSSSTVSNQWYFNGTKIVGASNQIYLADKNGSYAVEVINSDLACPSSKSNPYNLLVLAKENGWVEGVKVFPNPSIAELTISLPLNIIFHNLTIFDTKGKIIVERTDNNQSLDISRLSTGTYYIDILTNKGRVLKKIYKE